MNINDEYTASVIDMTTDGDGIAKIEDNYTIFVRGAIVGDEISFVLTKLNKTYGFGKLNKIVTTSPFRRTSVCCKFEKCGGCTLLNIKYTAQLDMKSHTVTSNMARIGGVSDYVYEGIIGADCEYNYRNKAQFPLGLSDKGAVCGFFLPKSHDIVSIDSCCIQSDRINAALNTVMEFIREENISVYNEKTHRGTVRHIYVRDGGDELMVCIVTNTPEKIKNAEKLAKSLSHIGKISLIQNINTQRTNVILGGRNITLFGNPYIIMNVGDIKFKVSPNSFFQVNTSQMLKLYQKALEYASPSESDTVFDLYCGVGSISLFLSKKVKEVVGVEIVEDAVKNAKENARLNGIENTSFYCGDCGETVDKLLSEGKRADIAVVDPPRKGCDDKTLELLNRMNPKKIVYVSCNSATLARDAAKLCGYGFKVDKLCAVDMFPQTMHVETVCLMSKIEK